MDILKEHNYGSAIEIKGEIDKTVLEIPEINIKTECDDKNGEEDYFGNEETEKKYLKVETPEKTRKRKTSDSESADDENAPSNTLTLSDLQKACVLQTCLSLLDSSSSDDDELMLLWLLCRNRKKKLRKRSRSRM